MPEEIPTLINPLLPSWKAIDGQICTQYQNMSVFASGGDPCYQVSNGSWVASAKEVMFYTDSEVLKIAICGGVLILAVMVITYALYKAYMQRYYQWLRNKELEDKMKVGVATQADMDELAKPIPGINKTMLFVAGLLVMLAGAAMWIMP
jgi:hypothetical protein